jgi:hypothetical protein
VADRLPTLATWASAHVVAVTAGGGSVWSLEEHATRAADHADIVQRDPVTGAVEKHWIVSATYEFIAYGYGKVWVWGGGVSAAPESIAMTLDPTSGARSATADLGFGNAFDSVVFAADGLISPPPQTNIIINPNYRIAAGAHPWVPAAGTTFWVSNRHGDLYREDLARLRRAGSAVTLPHVPLAVAADSSGGLYVALVSPSHAQAAPSLLYYSAAALDSASPRPTAIRNGDEVHRLAVDPAGGVGYTNSADALIHWNQAGPGLR